MSNQTNAALFDFKFYEWEKRFKDKPFLRQPFGDTWEEYTWGEVGQYARKLATGLRSLGLRENAHIGLISKNCREWIIADLAIVMAGYISVPFFPNLNAKEINTLLEFGDVDLLFVGKVEDWDEQKNGVPKGMPIISFPTYSGHSNITEGHQWFDFINQFEPLQNPNQPKLEDTWTIIYTSGTTGNPKGVVLNYLANEKTAVLTLESNPLKIDFNGKNDFFSYLPLNHIAERIVVEYAVFRFGGTISFAESLDTFAQNLQDVQPTVFFAVPRIWTKFQMGILSKIPQEKLDKLIKIPVLSWLLKRKFKKALGLSRARAIVSGAAPMLESQRTWFRKLGILITNGYGMTENCAITSQLDARFSHKPGSVGLPQPEVEVKIDPETSEILMRGPFVMKEYYKQPELTAEVLKDGWLHTGDQGHVDEDGFLFITGRVKDMFKTSKGKYIEPLILESYFADILEFEQICVAGLGLPQPICLVVLSEIGKSKSKEALTLFLNQRLEEVNEQLAGYKKISTIIVVNDEWTVENGLTTPTLKIKRNQVDKKYENNYEAWHKDTATVLYES
ncbi:MAG: AMP-binding protein [Flavobacteriaceae bacterium]